MTTSIRRATNIWLNDEFGELKAIREFNDWWFEAYSIAKKLGYRNPAVSVRQHVWKEFTRTDIPGCINKINGLNKIMLNISGVLQLIMSSKADNARRFQKWVYTEVLPSVMINGGYVMGQEKLPENERNALTSQIKQLSDIVKIQGDKLKELESFAKTQNTAYNKLKDRVFDLANDLQSGPTETNLF